MEVSLLTDCRAATRGTLQRIGGDYYGLTLTKHSIPSLPASRESGLSATGAQCANRFTNPNTMTDYRVEFAEVEDIRELNPEALEKLAQASKTGITMHWDGNTFFDPEPGQVDIARPRMRVVDMKEGHRTVRVSFKVEAIFGMEPQGADPDTDGETTGDDAPEDEDAEEDGDSEDPEENDEDQEGLTFTLGNPPEVES